MSFSLKESVKLQSTSVKGRLICEQNSGESHSAASTRILESLKPSWSLIPGHVDGFDPIPQSSPRKRTKDKRNAVD